MARLGLPKVKRLHNPRDNFGEFIYKPKRLETVDDWLDEQDRQRLEWWRLHDDLYPERRGRR